MIDEKDKVTLKIPRPLYEKLNIIIKGSGFHSVTEFVVYILRDLVSSKSSEAEPRQVGNGLKPFPTLTSQEIEIIKKRLKTLGYL
jgi:hypothetical protein